MTALNDLPKKPSCLSIYGPETGRVPHCALQVTRRGSTSTGLRRHICRAITGVLPAFSQRSCRLVHRFPGRAGEAPACPPTRVAGAARVTVALLAEANLFGDTIQGPA